jgi:N-hydroxyarylamine O-acetyltransferase
MSVFTSSRPVASKAPRSKGFFSIHAYLKRIGYQGPLQPDIHTLRALHRAHLQTVPFENLDIHLGQPIVLAESLLYEKIVTGSRGGFCYELNGSFATLLREMGFRVHRLSARVANGSGGYGQPFDHMALLVELNERWLADVGFGDSFVEPLRLDEPGEQLQRSGRYRIDAGGDGLVLFESRAGDWIPQYTFTLQPYPLGDFAETCRYHQTSPESTFTQRRVCTRATPVGRITLSERKLIVTKDGNRQERLLQSECEVYRALREHFGIELKESAWPQVL